MHPTPPSKNHVQNSWNSMLSEPPWPKFYPPKFQNWPNFNLRMTSACLYPQLHDFIIQCLWSLLVIIRCLCCRLCRLTRTPEFAYEVIVRSILGIVSAYQARCVPPCAIFLFPWVSFSNYPPLPCPRGHLPCMLTLRAPRTCHVSWPGLPSWAYHCATRDCRDHAPMPWQLRMAMAWGWWKNSSFRV